MHSFKFILISILLFIVTIQLLIITFIQLKSINI